MKRIGVLTGGGDCPGLNGAIRAVARTAMGGMGWEVVGFRNGWRGVMDRNVLELTTESVRGILHRGGTILGSSGANPYLEGGIDRIRATLHDLDVEGLIAIGGEGTLGAAAKMTEDEIMVLGIPMTMISSSPAPTTASGSTPPSRSPRTRSTACTAPRRATTA